MSFHYLNGWHVTFFESDRNRTQLARNAFFNSEETMIEFVRRANGVKTLEDRNILDMMIERNFGEVCLMLTAEQYIKLKG